MDAYALPPAEKGGPGSHIAAKVRQRFQVFLDRITPYAGGRWVAWCGLLVCFALRIYALEGFYIIAYALGIFNLNLLLGFISPQIDPELEGPVLPSKNEEFRPFVRRLPEYKFWYSSCKAFCFGFSATFVPFFDIPVFWPILVVYWLVLFFLTMKRQIKHMIKYRYLPFSTGKKKYTKAGAANGGKDLYDKK